MSQEILTLGAFRIFIKSAQSGFSLTCKQVSSSAEEECFAAFRGCYPGGVEQEAATVLPICGVFRED